MSLIILEDVIFILLLIGLSIPLGIYISKVMMGQKVFLSSIMAPVENIIYKVIGVHEGEEMTAKRYASSMLVFSAAGFIFLFIIQMLQGFLPFNPEKMGGIKWDLAFNTSASFVSNTNWQAYSGELSLSYFTQSAGLTVQNFLSAAVGVAVIFALIRGFIAKQGGTIGNFWKDITRAILYVFVPLSLILALVLVSQGVVQTIGPYVQAKMPESGVMQTIPLGPAASQIAIKQLGTNGGGFFGMNSAYPFENPTPLSNLVQLLSILIIPAALCVSFGKAINDFRQGRAVYITMLAIFILSLAAVTAGELYSAPSYPGVISSGSMEGKEIIHGIGTSALWGTATTAASNGSVNAIKKNCIGRRAGNSPDSD